MLDVDALGAAEGVSWVWAGSTVLDETLTLAQAPNLHPNPNPNVNPSPNPNPNPTPTPNPNPNPNLHQVLDEGPVRTDRVMISLSRGGSDATVAREFDLDKMAFVPVAEGGFELPEGKSDFCYKARTTSKQRSSE